MTLRNSPVDRRYEQTRDVPTGEAERQAKRTRARVGAMAYQRNHPERTTTRTEGTGGFGAGGAQARRASEKAAEEKRAEGFRPETLSVKDVRPEDPAYS